MPSAFKQLALLTVSSRSSTGQMSFGSINGRNEASSEGAIEFLISTKECNCYAKTVYAMRIASDGSIVPLVSISKISCSIPSAIGAV